MKPIRIFFLLTFLVVLAGSVCAQRRVNPVKSGSNNAFGVNENKVPGDSIDISRVTRVTDKNGNTVLVDTLTGVQMPDTLGGPQTMIPKMIQPLIYSASVGIDIWDPIMRVFGQKYGLIEFSGELNLHNRYIPVVEIGVGQTNYTPAKNNYTYKVGVTPYFRIGCNYNFIYNSNPDYMAFAGVRFGFSKFNYSLTDVTLTNDYWGDPGVVAFPKQSCSLTYMQIMFGIRVRIMGPISMGWAFRYKTRLHESKADFGEPWYIPGYGSRNSSITGSFSIFYTLPLGKDNWQKPPAPEY